MHATFLFLCGIQIQRAYVYYVAKVHEIRTRPSKGKRNLSREGANLFYIDFISFLYVFHHHLLLLLFSSSFYFLFFCIPKINPHFPNRYSCLPMRIFRFLSVQLTMDLWFFRLFIRFPSICTYYIYFGNVCDLTSSFVSFGSMVFNGNSNENAQNIFVMLVVNAKDVG